MCSIQWSGGGHPNLAFGPVNTSVKPQSNLVNPGQTWSKLSKLREMYSGPHFEVLLMRWVPVGSKRLSQTLVKIWSTLVKLGQNSPNSRKCAPGPVSRFFWCGGSFSGLISSVRVALFCMSTPEKIPEVKIGLWQHPQYSHAFPSPSPFPFPHPPF